MPDPGSDMQDYLEGLRRGRRVKIVTIAVGAGILVMGGLMGLVIVMDQKQRQDNDSGPMLHCLQATIDMAPKPVNGRFMYSIQCTEWEKP